MKDKKKQKIDEEINETVENEETSSVDLGINKDELTTDEYIEALEYRFGETIKEAGDLKNTAQRLQAEFDNYRKRNAQLSEEMKELGISMVVEKMLGVLDNCDLARKYITDESALMGFNMMENQIINALKSFGLEEINPEGQEFDAKQMNAVERVEGVGLENKVVEVVSKGFLLKGKLLRAASVKVGVEPKNE